MAKRRRVITVNSRTQTGHSIILFLILSAFVIGIPFLIYYTISPNHYWHI